VSQNQPVRQHRQKVVALTSGFRELEELGGGQSGELQLRRKRGEIASAIQPTSICLDRQMGDLAFQRSAGLGRA
jgi:hypothetical protein